MNVYILLFKTIITDKFFKSKFKILFIETATIVTLKLIYMSIFKKSKYLTEN